MKLKINEGHAAAPTVEAPHMRFSDPAMAKDFAKLCIRIRKQDKDLTPVDDEQGGYTIPEPQVEAEIFRMVERVGVASRIGRQVPMGAGGFRKVRRKAGATAYWKVPGGAATESSPTFGALDLRPETLIALVEDDWEWEEDTLVASGNYLAAEFAYAIAAEEDRCAFVGTGAPSDGGIVGVLNSDRTTVVDMAATKTSFADITFDNMVDLEAAVAEEALDGARWLFHRTVKALIKKLTDGTSLPVWQPAAGMEPSVILGYEHVAASKMRSTADDAVSTTFLAFGDFYQGLYVGKRGGLRIDYSDHANFANLQRVWRSHERVDIAVQGFTSAEIAANTELANPIAILKTAAS